MDNVAVDAPKPKKLPTLRPGLSLDFHGYDHDGVPQWNIYDASRNNFFTIGLPEYEILKRWSLGDGKAIVDQVNAQTTVKIEMEDFYNLLNFLDHNYLVEQKWFNIYSRAKKQKIVKSENILYWLIRYYLFFRIPLLHPDKFLKATKKFGDFLFKKSTLYFMSFLGVVACYEVGLQWDKFIHTFSSIFSWQGLVYYFVAFSFSKFFHELGHAYMCKKYDVPVPTMGVAFLVFWPVLYTDTTLSWTLPSHQRLRVAIAGMWVETYIAIIAALIWCFVPDVTIQMICYITVAVNWVSTLLINVSPFMRFDGYYVASDLLKIPNLQNRAFSLTRWQLRNWFFGWEDPYREHFSNKMHWTLVIYSLVTWIYRLGVYFGIALLVYHYFFKALGIILFGIELFAFILRPFFHEFEIWYKNRKQFTLNNKTKLTLALLAALLATLILPLQSSLKLSATISAKHQFLFSSYDANLLNMVPKIGDTVNKDDLLAIFTSPDLDYSLTKSKLDHDKILAEYRRANYDSKFETQKQALQAELISKEIEYNSLKDKKEKMSLKAPFKGVVKDIAADLHPGSVVMKDQWILDIIDPEDIIIEAYISESDLERIKLGTIGKFYPNNPESASIPVKIASIEDDTTESLSWHFSKKLKQTTSSDSVVDTPIYNSTDFGGKIPTNLSSAGDYVPIESMFRVLLVPESPVTILNVEQGTVVLKATPVSLTVRAYEKLKKIIIQESGF